LGSVLVCRALKNLRTTGLGSTTIYLYLGAYPEIFRGRDGFETFLYVQENLGPTWDFFSQKTKLKNFFPKRGMTLKPPP